MSVILTPPVVADLEALLDFELRNRLFFEKHINARPPAFYSAEGVAQAIDMALDDAVQDRCYQFLLRTADGNIIGRFNLGGVKRAHFHSAVMGYRMAEDAAGKGYASAAVGHLLEIAFGELGLARIEADARAENEASVRVLVRNGFVQYGHSKRSFQLGDRWYDRLHFERHSGAVD